MRLNVLIKKALRSAPPAEAERIKKALREGKIGEVLPELVKLAEGEGQLAVYYAPESRFKAAEEREEAAGEVEEPVGEEALEPVEEAEEPVEDDEYLGQHVVKRVLPEKTELRRRLF